MEILTHLFELLFQGAAAGLIVLAVTHYLQHRREIELSRKYSLLVYVEIHGHITALDSLSQAASRGQLLPKNTVLNCLSEELAMPYLTGLPIDDLQKIAIYYQSVLSLNQFFADNGDMLLSGEMLAPLRQALLMAKATNAMLESHWKP